ncbi:MAG: PhoH family protein, partial [Holdemania filiformis]
LMGAETTEKLIEKGTIEIAPLAYMRGRTLDDAVIILDEAQNTTPAQMKMFLTRLGFQSRMIITGDVTQVDLPKSQRSGLMDAVGLLKGIEEIGVLQLSSDDVVRHPLVQKIIDRYGEKGGIEHAADSLIEDEDSIRHLISYDLKTPGLTLPVAQWCQRLKRGWL